MSTRRRARLAVRTLAGEGGFSLIVAMLMLLAIGLASGAVMRNATLGDHLANDNRLHAQASQYAQFALRSCENQLALAPASRSVTLLAAASPPAWSAPGGWTSAAHALSAADLGGGVQPRVAPQCLMEATSLSDVYTVTARGFSADVRDDPLTGAPRSGSVVWLQATLYAEAAPTGGLAVRQRLWQPLLTPPF